MEFDADWIWIAIFGGVMIVRALSSRVARSRKRANTETPPVRPAPSRRRASSEGDMGRSFESYSASGQPKPIEPR